MSMQLTRDQTFQVVTHITGLTRRYTGCRQAVPVSFVLATQDSDERILIVIWKHSQTIT